MTRQRLLFDDLHRLAAAIRAIDVDNPPQGRDAARALNRLELARNDLRFDLAKFMDWLQVNASENVTPAVDDRTSGPSATATTLKQETT